jgi:glucosamine-6-phosphate deaminase
MNVYALKFEEFSKLRPWKFTKVADVDALNQLVADEVVAALKLAASEGRRLMVIGPVGPLNYSYWADLMNREQTNGAHLITVNMDEFVDESGELVAESHPLSFRRFMKETFFDRLRGDVRVPEENIHFPSPKSPEVTTRLIEEHGGADLCYGGMGLTGHFAFNDPPPPDEPCDDNEVRNWRTRVLRLGPESRTQMCMGGTDGNWEVIPKHAVTLGMYELLMSKSIHLAFLRSWHAGVMRRALFGEVTGRCPGSFIQQHKNVRVTATELAAAVPRIHVALRVA